MSKPKVLIVEDNAVNAIVLSKAISGLGDPIHVEDDKSAFSQLEQEHFSLILMDINLGGDSLDGEAIMKQLKDQARYQHLPIIAVTSYAMPGDRERFLSVGFDDYLPKPVRKQDLLERVSFYLGLQPDQ